MFFGTGWLHGFFPCHYMSVPFFECIWHWNPLLKIWFMSLLCDSVVGAQVLVSFKATLEAKKLNGHLVQDGKYQLNERRSGNWQMMTLMNWPEIFQSIMILFGFSDCWCQLMTIKTTMVKGLASELWLRRYLPTAPGPSGCELRYGMIWSNKS